MIAEADTNAGEQVSRCLSKQLYQIRFEVRFNILEVDMKLAIHGLKKCLLGAVVFLLFSGVSVAETVVIAGAGSDVLSSLSASEIKALYLGKSKDLTIFDQKTGASVRKDFLDKVVGKSESQFKAYWSKRIFTGKGTPPKQLDGDAAMKIMVANTPGSIGIIDSASVDSSVKVIYKVK
jgi:hypothetical protein